MISFVRELRRREVFRTVGLYVGVSWILIEAASILLPVFEAPEWALRGLVITAIVGFPVVAILAWIYDVGERGISREADLVDTPVPAFGGRKMDFVVIGLLSMALIFSAYLNVSGDPGIVEELEPISVLIADFENRTGDPIFDELLEQALLIGIETAPHIASLERNDAATLAGELQTDTDGLPVPVARLVAARQGTKLVLAGSIARMEQGFGSNCRAWTR